MVQKQDFEELEEKVVNMNRNELPSLLRKFVPLFIEFMTSDEMITQKAIDKDIYLDRVEELAPKFADRFPFLLHKLANDPTDVTNLYFFIEKLEEQSGQSLNEKTQDVVNFIGDSKK